MADKNIQMTQRNATNDGWDNLNPLTKGANVLAADGITTFESHLADNAKHPQMILTSHVGNAYAVTVPGLTVLTTGYPLCIQLDAAATGAMTVNPSVLGAKSIVDYFGNPVTSAPLGCILNMRYNGTSFQLLGKGGGGNTVAAHILAGDTATVDTGSIVGSMPNNSAPTATITTQGGTVVIPGGYSPGGTITANLSNMVASNIKLGATVGGLPGAFGGDFLYDTSFGFTAAKSGSLAGVTCDGTYVYILDSISGAPKCYKYNLSGGLISTVSPSGMGNITIGQSWADSTYWYLMTNPNGVIFKMNLDGSNCNQLVNTGWGGYGYILFGEDPGDNTAIVWYYCSGTLVHKWKYSKSSGALLATNTLTVGTSYPLCYSGSLVIPGKFIASAIQWGNCPTYTNMKDTKIGSIAPVFAPGGLDVGMWDETINPASDYLFYGLNGSYVYFVTSSTCKVRRIYINISALSNILTS